MMAVPPEVVEDHLALLDEVGVVPAAIDAEPIALFRTFERFLRRRADEQAVSVIVDIGYSATRVVVSRGRDVVFIKSLKIGGQTFTDAVAGQLNLTYDEASDLRMRSMREGTPPRTEEAVPEDEEASPTRHRSSVEWSIHDAIRGQAEALAREISLCLRYCSVTFRGLRPKAVTLTGGETYDRALVELLGDHLGVGCEVGHPLRGIDTSAVDLGADRRETATEWALCTGLAIRGFDFEKDVQEKEHERHRLSA